MSPDDFLPGGSTECGIATIAYGTLFAYRTDVFPTDPPKSWADFWNVEKYPGKRALRANKVQGSLEFALIADGVPPADVYKVLRSEGGNRSRIREDGRDQGSPDLLGRPAPTLRSSSRTRRW